MLEKLINETLAAAERYLESAKSALDDPYNYGSLIQYTNYQFNLGMYYGIMDTLDAMSDSIKSNAWYNALTKHHATLHELEERADRIYTSLKTTINNQ